MKHKELLDRAISAFRVNDLEVAERLTKELLNDFPDLAAARVLLGTVYGRQNRHSDAIESFETAISLEPQNAEALNNLAVIYRQIGRTDDALEHVNKALAQEPDNPEILYNLGNIQKDLGNSREAIEAYERAVELEPDLAPAYNNLGTMYDRLGDTSSAINAFQRGLRYDKNHPTLNYNLGNSLQSVGRLKEAKESYQVARRVRPGWADALNNLGIVLDRLNDPEEALQTFEELLEVNPGDVKARNNIGTVLARQGRIDDAIEHFNTALAQQPKYTRAASNLGQLAAKASDPENSRAILQRLLKQDPDNIELRKSYAGVLTQTGMHQDALKHWEKISADSPKDPETIKELGLAQYRVGDRAKGEQTLQSYAEARPGDTSYLSDVARILQGEGLYDEALVLVDRAVKANPKDVSGLLRKAEILAELGREDEARESLGTAEGLRPEDRHVFAARANVFRALGDRDEALSAAERLISLQGQRASSDDLSSLNDSLELYEQMVEAWDYENVERWDRNLEKLGRLAEAGRVSDENRPVEADETAVLDEESIPILNFTGGSAFAEEEDLEEEEEEPEVQRFAFETRVESSGGDNAGGTGAQSPGAAAPPPTRQAGPDPYEDLRNMAEEDASLPFVPPEEEGFRYPEAVDLEDELVGEPEDTTPIIQPNLSPQPEEPPRQQPPPPQSAQPPQMQHPHPQRPPQYPQQPPSQPQKGQSSPPFREEQPYQPALEQRPYEQPSYAEPVSDYRAPPYSEPGFGGPDTDEMIPELPEFVEEPTTVPVSLDSFLPPLGDDDTLDDESWLDEPSEALEGADEAGFLENGEPIEIAPEELGETESDPFPPEEDESDAGVQEEPEYWESEDDGGESEAPLFEEQLNPEEDEDAEPDDLVFEESTEPEGRFEEEEVEDLLSADPMETEGEENDTEDAEPDDLVLEESTEPEGGLEEEEVGDLLSGDAVEPIDAEGEVAEPEEAVIEEPIEQESASEQEEAGLRDRLREMVQKAREQLGPEDESIEEEIPDSGDPGLSPLARHAQMFSYLMRLANNLPPARDREYRQSEERLKLAAIVARLNGRSTLRGRAGSVAGDYVSITGRSTSRGRTTAPARPGVHLSTQRMSATFGYLADLSSYLPDREIADQLSKRAVDLSRKLQNVSSNMLE